jgi:RNA polymerase primary sigma factor
MKKIRNHEILTREQEVELAKKIEAGDRQARDKMINANIRLATSIAKKYAGKGVDFDDLQQESTIGLMKAIDRFDWRRGFKFSTYAYWWILQTVKQYVESNRGPIALPANTSARLYRASKAREDFEKEFGVAPSDTELAELLGTTNNTLSSLKKSSAFYVSLDAPTRAGVDSRSYRNLLVDDALNPEEALEAAQTKKAVNEALSTLSRREQAVLRLRFGIEL